MLELRWQNAITRDVQSILTRITALTNLQNDQWKWEHTTLYESLKTNNACFHRNCGTKYNKQKVERFTKKRDNAEQPSPLVRRSSIEKKDFAAVFCLIWNQTDSSENLCTYGSFHVTKRSVNAKHNKEVTENWKSMALKVANKKFLSLLPTGEVCSNELYYHAKCYKSLWNQCIKINKENNSHDIEMKWRRVQVYESIVSFVLEQEVIEPGSTFIVKDLNELNIKNLKSFGIEDKAQATIFISIVYQTWLVAL